MARTTYEELAESLLQQQAEFQKLKEANQLLIKILSEAVPQMEARHGRIVMEQVFQAHKRTERKE
jgi:hypothetical protein